MTFSRREFLGAVGIATAWTITAKAEPERAGCQSSQAETSTPGATIVVITLRSRMVATGAEAAFAVVFSPLNIGP
jgi:hypothetical protein